MLLDEYLEKEEAATVLKVTKRTLDRWWSERIGPPRTKVGRRSVYRRSALTEWLKANEEFPVRERAA